MSAQSSSVASASFSATAADEAAAISAGYVKGRTTVYYTDCKRLPTMQSRPAHAGSRSAPQGSTPASMQLGDFSFLPHPGYAGRSGKTGLTVEIVVQDPATQHERVFRCPLAPLRSNMRYFESSIARQINEVKMAAVTSPTGTTPPVALRAKCDHRTFDWLLEWVKGNSPSLTTHNVVNVSLSSSFLQMRALSDEALLYLCSHLPELATSSIDLTTLPMDLVLRLSRVVRDSDLAVVLQHLYDRRSTAHPNRAFVASLLHHYVCYRLGLEGEEVEADKHAGGGGARADVAGDAANGSAKKKAVGWRGEECMSGSRTAAAATATKTNHANCEGLTLKTSSGLRWCRLCATLFDQSEMQRLLRAFQLSALECPAQSSSNTAAAAASSSPSPQPADRAANGAHNGTPASGTASGSVRGAPVMRCVGPRGEVFTTHAESRHALPVVLEAPPAVKYDRAASTASTMRLECWAWRIVGATRYVSCRRCFHLVPLTDVPSHHCSNLPQKFASPDNVADDVDHLVRWFTYCHEHRVYAEQGGLTPVLYNGPRQVLAEEVVEVPAAPKGETAGASKGGGAAGDKESKSGCGGSWASTAAHSPMSFWATKPFYVAEVMDKGIVDIDIQNYVERQHRFEVEAQQRKASALFNPPLLRLASSPALVPVSSSSPSPRLVASVSGGSSTGSLSRGKVGGNPTRVRASARSPYGF